MIGNGGVVGGSRPDLSPAQLVAVLVAGVPIVSNLLHVFGVFDLGHDQQQALQDTLTWGGVFGGLLIGGDSINRAARNAKDAKVEATALATESLPPDVAHVELDPEPPEPENVPPEGTDLEDPEYDPATDKPADFKE